MAVRRLRVTLTLAPAEARRERVPVGARVDHPRARERSCVR